MPDPIYPAGVRGLTYPVTKSPVFDTMLQQSPGHIEVRERQVDNPAWRWELIYDYLKDDPNDIAPGLTDTDLRTLLGFVLQRRGKSATFLYSDPDDRTVGPALNPDTTPNILASLPLLQDSLGNWYSPIRRLIGGFSEDITDLDPDSTLGSIAVYANGVLQSSGMTMNPPDKTHTGLWISWASMPTAPITAAFDFYFRVRFDSDATSFEKFTGALTPQVWDTDQYLPGLWTAGGNKGQRGGSNIVLVRDWQP